MSDIYTLTCYYYAGVFMFEIMEFSQILIIPASGTGK